MSFMGEFVLIGECKVGEHIALDPRTSTAFASACAFASRVELVSAAAEFSFLDLDASGGIVFAGFIGSDVLPSRIAVRASPDSVALPQETGAGGERHVPFTANAFFGHELKGAVLGPQPPKFVVWPVLRASDEYRKDVAVYARLTIRCRLIGAGAGSGSE